MSTATARKPAPGSTASWWRQVHQNSGNPCRSSTSGPSPASAAWKRVPLAEIDLCAQGPPIWTTASAPPAMTVTSPGLARGDLGLLAVGLLAVAAEDPETLGHGLARLLQSGQPPQLQVGDPEYEDREQHVDAGHDQEGRPRPDAECDQAEPQRDGQQDEHQAGHEGSDAAQGPG